MQKLTPYYKNSTENYEVKCSVSLDASHITISFKVKNDKGYRISSKFKEKEISNWGLWEYDVVELFIQGRDHEEDCAALYHEMQVSPLNQQFALDIEVPRKKYSEPENFPVSIFSEVQGQVWNAKFVIPSSYINSENIFIGLFACLGDEPREFYGLNIDQSEKLDFHKPKLFLPLEDLL
jgi:hypothetical protein